MILKTLISPMQLSLAQITLYIRLGRATEADDSTLTGKTSPQGKKMVIRI
jgi:hypothetical protein